MNNNSNIKSCILIILVGLLMIIAGGRLTVLRDKTDTKEMTISEKMDGSSISQ